MIFDAAIGVRDVTTFVAFISLTYAYGFDPC
jgi:hypothetical protein